MDLSFQLPSYHFLSTVMTERIQSDQQCVAPRRMVSLLDTPRLQRYLTQRYQQRYLTASVEGTSCLMPQENFLYLIKILQFILTLRNN